MGQFTSDDQELYTSYGIACDELVIEDITNDQRALKDFIQLINRMDVSPLHLQDVVEDFLVALYS